MKHRTIRRTTFRRGAALPATALWLLLLFSGSAVAGPGGAQPLPGASVFPDVARQTAEERVAVALRLEIEEQQAAAALAYQEAMAAEPRLVAVQRSAGDHHAWLGRWDASAAAYGAITRLDPYSPEGYALLGEVGVLQGEAAGVERLQKALEMDVAAAAARLPLARIARAAGDLVRLSQILEGIAPEERELPEVVLEWASLHVLQGESTRAKALLEKLLADRPDDAALPLRVAERWLAHGRCGEALPLLRREASARPRAEVLRSLGWGLLCCGQPAIQAAGAFTAALQRDGSDDGARIGLAWALMALDQPGEPMQLAGQWLEEVLRKNPSFAGALLAQAELKRRLGRPDEAAVTLDRISPAHPAGDEADNQRARLAIEREDPYAAIALLRKLLERRPDLLHARINLVEAYLRAGRSNEAREVVRSLSVQLAEGHPLRAHAERLLGNPRSSR